MNHQLKIETKKEKKENLSSWLVIPTGTKGTAHVARPGGLFSPGWYYRRETGTKGGSFSPGIVLLVPKPGLKVVENREYSLFLYQ